MSNKVINILLADDDEDDRFFFAKELKGLTILTKLSTVENGEYLMNQLITNPKQLPDLLFLDLNMPRKNGSECLVEIKSNKHIKNLPVVIYSTSLSNTVADQLYKNGAHYYLRKGDLPELRGHLQNVLNLFLENNFKRPSREGFILKLQEV